MSRSRSRRNTAYHNTPGSIQAERKLRLEPLEYRNLLSVTYSVTDLGRKWAEPTSINDKLQVVGTTWVDYGPAGEFEAPFLWESGTLQLLPDIVGLDPDFTATVSDINNNGQIAGSIPAPVPNYYWLDSMSAAVIWEPGAGGNYTVRQLFNVTDPEEGDFSYGWGINDSGQIVGTYGGVIDGQNPRAFIWESGNPTFLGGIGNAYADDINNLGQIVGWSRDVGAFLWDSGSVTTLPFSPTAINDVGQVIGGSSLWESGVTTTLDALPGHDYGEALDINNRGQAVGYSFHFYTEGSTWHFEYRGVLWESGEVVDLNDRINPNSGWYLGSATAINNQGCIVGVGTFNGEDRAYLLRPEVCKPSLVFRDMEDGVIPGIDHVGFFPGGVDKVWESHPGYEAGNYEDRLVEPHLVPVAHEPGVQQQHTRGSFFHNALEGKTSTVAWTDEIQIADPRLEEDILAYIESKHDAGFLHWLEYLGIPTIVSPYLQKGASGTYSCVGLIEAAAESAPYFHDGEGFIPNEIEDNLFKVWSGPNGVTTTWGFCPELLYMCATDESVWEDGWLSLLVDPVDFVLTDPLGRRLGHADGQTYDEIPNGCYSGNGEVEIVLLPEKIPGEYSIDFFGLGGEYGAAIVAKSPDSDVQKWTFSGYLEIGETYQTTLDSPEIVGVTVNDGSAQRSMVTSLTVSFDRAIQFAAGAFELLRRDGTSVPVTAALSPDATDVILTFAGSSLEDGIYDLTVRKEYVEDDQGAQMATDYLFTFHRLFGDSDGDADVDGVDLRAFRSSYGKLEGMAGYLWYFDADDDDDVDRDDYAAFRANYRELLMY